MTERQTKKWGKVDKAALLSLIEDGSVSVDDNRTEYIDWVGAEYFGHRAQRNFRRKRSTAAQGGGEKKVSPRVC